MDKETMALRCMFAAHALSMLADPNCASGSELIAGYAWEISDAMINEMYRKRAQWREEAIMGMVQDPVNVGDGYRQLELDEIIQQGDEYQCRWTDEKWSLCPFGGKRVREMAYETRALFRRKVTP